MRVAIVTESLLPQTNGVTNSVRHVAERLEARGHQVLVVVPGPGPTRHRGIPVVRVRSASLPGYRTFPVGLPDRIVERTLADFAPDVVHLASPIALGAVGLRAARRLGVPTVAVYQTDIAGFARQYGVRADLVIDRWVGRLHRRADRTLVPSTAARDQLAALGVPGLHLWGRGVTLDLFSPSRRSDTLRRSLLRPQDEVLVGYVGRLAAEKKVRRLTELRGLRGARLVVVGDGPERDWLERRMPEAVFTGMLGATTLAKAFASLDVFVHTGESETFCQTIQEAQASGVPVVAPAAGGPLDLVVPGVTGLFHDPADPPSLRRTVAGLAQDAPLRRGLAAAGLAAVSTRGWGGLVDTLVEQHYAAVVSARTTRAAA